MADQPGDIRSAADVLTEWRDAERRVDDEPAGTRGWHRARLDAARLADEYRALIVEREDEARDLAANPSAS